MKRFLTLPNLALVIMFLMMLINVEHLVWVHHDIAQQVFHIPRFGEPDISIQV